MGCQVGYRVHKGNVNDLAVEDQRQQKGTLTQGLKKIYKQDDEVSCWFYSVDTHDFETDLSERRRCL